jgi:hypothetical protein
MWNCVHNCLMVECYLVPHVTPVPSSLTRTVVGTRIKHSFGVELAVEQKIILLSTRQLSELLNIPLGTLRYWRKMGVGPAWVKLEGTIRYNWADVDEYVSSNTRQPSVRAHVEEQRVHL